MFEFLRQKSRSSGSVLFRGNLPSKLENFSFLSDLGVALEPRSCSAEYLWAAHLQHLRWGEADLLCPRSTLAPPPEVVRLDPRLTETEVSAISECGSSVQMTMSHHQQNVLRERKLALRMMRAIMGAEGVSAVDHGSQRFWSRRALDEELSHDADLDIESLFVLHAVGGDETEKGSVDWLHSHGLAELGYFDFDIIAPSPDVYGNASDLTRAVAYSIVECRIEADSSDILIAQPGGSIRMVPASVFTRRAAREYVALREDPQKAHVSNRSVLCEPFRARFWSRLIGERIEPSRFLRGPIDENSLIYFSNEASELMAQRARGSYSLCRAYAQEFAEFESKTLVKLGLPVDGGTASDREHLWFEASGLSEDRITGVLLNDPWHIAALKSGQSYTYGLDVLTEWAIFTPAGRITPVEGVAVRKLREQRDEILEAMRLARKFRDGLPSQGLEN